MVTQKHNRLDSPTMIHSRIKRQDMGNSHNGGRSSAGHTPIMSSAETTQMAVNTAQDNSLDYETSETWASCAKCAFAIGDLELAFSSCQNSLEKNPANVLALCTISATYREDDYKTRQCIGVDHALNLLNEAIKLYPSLSNEITILKELAECQFTKNMYDQARISCERILQINDYDAKIWLMEGKCLIRSESIQKQRPLDANSNNNNNNNNSNSTAAIDAFHTALSRLVKPISQNSEFALIATSCYTELSALALAEGNLELALNELNNTLSLGYINDSYKYELSYAWCALALSMEFNGNNTGISATDKAKYSPAANGININGSKSRVTVNEQQSSHQPEQQIRSLQICESARKSLGFIPLLIITEAYLLLLHPTVENANKAVYLLQHVIDNEKSFINARGPTNSDTDSNDAKDFLPYYLLGVAFSFIDEPNNSYEALHVALSRAPSSPFPWISVGGLYLQLNQLRDSLAAYSKAAKLKEDLVGFPVYVVIWKGLVCVYERCDNQFVDAANACNRAAAYARLSEDIKTMNDLEQHAHALMAAQNSGGSSNLPTLLSPPEPPLALLRDLILLSPEERIELVHNQNIQQQQYEQNIEQQQHQTQVQAPSSSVQQAPTPVSQQPANVGIGITHVHPSSHMNAPPLAGYGYPSNRAEIHPSQQPHPPAPPPQYHQGNNMPPLGGPHQSHVVTSQQPRQYSPVQMHPPAHSRGYREYY